MRLWPDGGGAAGAEEHAWRGRRVHFIGIGGIGMSAMARLLLEEGCAVSGCDASPNQVTESLERMGVPVAPGHSPDHVERDTDLIIVSAAVRETNPELRRARAKGLPVLKYAQALGRLMRGREGVAVAGSHGKTTTTSMIAYVLDRAGRDPSMLIGGHVPQLGGGSRNGRRGPFVVEACEYDRSFLNLSPRVAVITNIDRDHLDYYSGLEELVEAFGSFAARVDPDGVVVANGDDPNAVAAARRGRARVVTFGEGRECDWRLEGWSRADGRTRFRAVWRGAEVGEFEMLVPGLYNVKNALACMAVCGYFGVDLAQVREALGSFRGARRRFDRLGEAAGVMVLDDYGHHPTEVRVTLTAARDEYPRRRLWCVFQPHQCSRTRILLDDFARSFGAADRVIVPDIYSVRDTEADRRSVHARDLVGRLRRYGVEAEYRSPFVRVVRTLLGRVRPGDLVLTMGAGPVDWVGRRLLEGLREREGSHGLVLGA